MTVIFVFNFDLGNAWSTCHSLVSSFQRTYQKLVEFLKILWLSWIIPNTLFYSCTIFCSVIHPDYSLIKTILNKLSNFLESEWFFNEQWRHSEKSQKNLQVAARFVKLRASGWLYRSDERNMEEQSDTWLDIDLTIKLWYLNVAIFLEAKKKVPVKTKNVLPKDPQASTSRAKRVGRRKPPLNHLDVVSRSSSSSEDWFYISIIKPCIMYEFNLFMCVCSVYDNNVQKNQFIIKFKNIYLKKNAQPSWRYTYRT